MRTRGLKDRFEYMLAIISWFQGKTSRRQKLGLVLGISEGPGSRTSFTGLSTTFPETPASFRIEASPSAEQW